MLSFSLGIFDAIFVAGTNIVSTLYYNSERRFSQTSYLCKFHPSVETLMAHILVVQNSKIIIMKIAVVECSNVKSLHFLCFYYC